MISDENILIFLYFFFSFFFFIFHTSFNHITANFEKKDVLVN